METKVSQESFQSGMSFFHPRKLFSSDKLNKLKFTILQFKEALWFAILFILY